MRKTDLEGLQQSAKPHNATVPVSRSGVTFADGEGGRGRFSPGGISQHVPSFQEGSSSSSPPPPLPLRSWSRNCWGTVPAFPAVARSTTRRRLSNGDKTHQCQVSGRHQHQEEEKKKKKNVSVSPSLMMSMTSSALKLSSSVS